MYSRVSRPLALLVALVLGGVLIMTGSAAAQPPGYGDGGPTVSLSASVSADSVTAAGSGFDPGEPVTGTVFSDPMDLGTRNADAAGAVSFTFSVRDLAPGEHRVVLSAPSGSITAFFTVTAASDGTATSSVAAVNSSDAVSGDELAYTGSNLVIPVGIAALLLLVGGGAAVVVGRRGRAREENRR